MIKGIIDSGGFSEIWTIADRGQRLQFFKYYFISVIIIPKLY